MIGENVPVPLPGLLRSARALSSEHLGWVAGEAARLHDASDADMLFPRVPPRLDNVHPAWRGALPALVCYGLAAAREQLHREESSGDYEHGRFYKVYEAHAESAARMLRALQGPTDCLVTVQPGRKNQAVPAIHARWWDPSWMGMPEVHARHRAKLLELDPVWYRAQGWREQLTWVQWPDLELPANKGRGPRWALNTELDWRVGRRHRRK